MDVHVKDNMFIIKLFLRSQYNLIRRRLIIMEDVTCVILDFDDTIILSELLKKEVFLEISKQYGQPAIDYYNDTISNKPSRFVFLKGLSQVVIRNCLVDRDMYNYLYCLLLTNCNDIISARLKDSEELPNVREFIEHLHLKKYKLFISSKSDEKDIIETLEHKNLLHYFDGIYGNSFDKLKHFEIIMKEHELTKDNICFIGDSESDYKVSYYIDCKFIGILTELNELKNTNCLKINDYNKIIHKF